RDGPATLLVDEGPAKGRRIVIIGAGASGRIQVRFPRLEPGYLIDVIGLRHDGFLEALIPATAQPPYHAGHPPVPPMVSGHVPDSLSGTAVWHEPGEEPVGLLGLAYPALDPETSCERTRATPTCEGDLHAVDPHTTGPGCVRLPYLSVGSTLRLRNDRAAVLRSLRRMRHLPQGADRRPHDGRLRRAWRRSGGRLLQRDDDDRRVRAWH